ncbi:MAG TPA: hypothetical protein VMZ06_11260 [Candidatus Bathyarchaeia archaeon]|nr:hypothetical protein [Candidatus Bathyarchaeia archaeon]
MGATKRVLPLQGGPWGILFFQGVAPSRSITAFQAEENDQKSIIGILSYRPTQRRKARRGKTPKETLRPLNPTNFISLAAIQVLFVNQSPLVSQNSVFNPLRKPAKKCTNLAI